jgi:5-methylcytosine-specific restriction endonuclease McrA
MQLFQIDHQYFIRMSDVASVLKLNPDVFTRSVERYEWNKHRLERQKHDGQDIISCKSTQKYLKWYLGITTRHLPEVNDFKHSLAQYAKKIPKRTLSRSMRVEIAYRQNYECRRCGLFPIPPTFEVDHIIELQDGGQDVAENLQALCPQCHKEKTRLNRLRKSSIFRDSVMAEYERFIQPAAEPRKKRKRRPEHVPMPKRNKVLSSSEEDVPDKLIFSKYFCQKKSDEI